MRECGSECRWPLHDCNIPKGVKEKGQEFGRASLEKQGVGRTLAKSNAPRLNYVLVLHVHDQGDGVMKRLTLQRHCEYNIHL